MYSGKCQKSSTDIVWDYKYYVIIQVKCIIVLINFGCNILILHNNSTVSICYAIAYAL